MSPLRLVHSSLPTWGCPWEGAWGGGSHLRPPRGMSASSIRPCLGPPTRLERLALPVQTGGVLGPAASLPGSPWSPNMPCTEPSLDSGPACFVVLLAPGQRAGGGEALAWPSEPQGLETTVPAPSPLPASHHVGGCGWGGCPDATPGRVCAGEQQTCTAGRVRVALSASSSRPRAGQVLLSEPTGCSPCLRALSWELWPWAGGSGR